MKRPSFQFYPGDWLNDAALRMVSVGARGLWMDMICIMHQGSPYGHLKVNSKAITDIQLGRMAGEDKGEVSGWLVELEEAGVLSRTDEGVIFSRRMVADEKFREIRAAGGKEGGNPQLMGGYNKPGFVYVMHREGDGRVKIGISQDPAKRLYKVRAQHPGEEIKVVAKKYVEDMGATEANLHALFGHKKSGEWFDLDEGEMKILLDVHLKANSTPSSSSSSSSSISLPKGKDKATASGGSKTWLTASDMIAGAKGLTEPVAGEYLRYRRAKRAPLTELAWAGIVSEVAKTGRPIDKALGYAMSRGWTGFDCAWLTREQGNNGAPTSRAEQRDEFFDSLYRGNPHDQQPASNDPGHPPRDFIDAESRLVA